MKRGRDEALALLKTVSRVVTAKGKKIVVFDLTHNRPDDETLVANLLGPTGNLRAPTLRKGSTLYVGFSEDVYRELLR